MKFRNCLMKGGVLGWFDEGSLEIVFYVKLFFWKVSYCCVSHSRSTMTFLLYEAQLNVYVLTVSCIFPFKFL